MGDHHDSRIEAPAIGDLDLKLGELRTGSQGIKCVIWTCKCCVADQIADRGVGVFQCRPHPAALLTI